MRIGNVEISATYITIKENAGAGPKGAHGGKLIPVIDPDQKDTIWLVCISTLFFALQQNTIP